MTLGQRIAALRKRRGLTQDQIAEALGVKRARYNAWENGISKPDHIMLAKIAQFHGVTVDFLLGLPHPEGKLMLTDDMYADGYTDESFFEELELELQRNYGTKKKTTAIPLTPDEQELILLFRQTDKIPEEEREKLKNTIADTIDLYLSRAKKN